MNTLFNTSWHRGRIVAFDTETSGVSVDHDRIITATVATIEGRDVTVRSWLLQPVFPIPAEATAVHGVTTEHAREHGQAPEDGIQEIAAAINQAWEDDTPVIAYNAGYDFTILDRECARYGATFEMPCVIDPFVIDKHVDKYRKGSRKLVDACAHYGVALGEAHNATDDALAAARVAWALAERYPDVVQVDPVVLHQNQMVWKREQADSFGAYLVKQGKPDDVAREWPIQPAPEGWAPEQLPDVREDGAA